MIFLYLLIIPLFMLWYQSVYASQELFYEIYYGPMKLGESKIVIKDKELKAVVYTTGIGNAIYPYYAEWTTNIDENGYPIKAIIYSKDRFKERKKIIYFLKGKNQVIVEKILPKPKKRTYTINFPVFDELSGFVYSWSTNSKFYNIPLFIDGEKHFAVINYKGESMCKVNNSNEICESYLIHLPEVSELLKRAKEVKSYLSKNKRIPIILEGKLPLFGALRAELRSFTVY